MTAPAPYSRETLDRIRRGDGPTQLGWTQQRFDKVCAHHGIGSLVRSAGAAVLPPVRISAPVKREIRPAAASDYVSAKLSPATNNHLQAESIRLGIKKGAIVRMIVAAALEQDIIELLIVGQVAR